MVFGETVLMKPIFGMALFLWLLLPAVFAQDNDACSSFRQAIESTYNFKPSKLTNSEQAIKSAAMDRFWQMTKADAGRLLPCLRVALQDRNADKWFRFDASSLLVEIDPSPASKAVQVSSYTYADLDDVDLRTWVRVLASLGVEGFDVSEAGSRWLDYPKASYFLPEHGAYEVETFQGALFLFGSMDESQATPALLKILAQASHPHREFALELLMAQATPEALRALKQLDTSQFSAATRDRIRRLLIGPKLLKPRLRPKTKREEFIQAFQQIIDRKPDKFLQLAVKIPDGEKDVVAVLQPQDLPLVRKVRRMFIASGTPHAIEYYKSFTEILMTLVWKPELVK
jgi:hypothetical protein